MVRIARSTDKLKEMLREPGPALIFATIQKYRNPDLGPGSSGDGDDDADDDGGHEGPLHRLELEGISQPLHCCLPCAARLATRRRSLCGRALPD